MQQQERVELAGLAGLAEVPLQPWVALSLWLLLVHVKDLTSCRFARIDSVSGTLPDHSYSMDNAWIYDHHFLPKCSYPYIQCRREASVKTTEQKRLFRMYNNGQTEMATAGGDDDGYAWAYKGPNPWSTIELHETPRNNIH